MFSKSVVAMGLVALLATPAMAQQRGRGGFGMGRGGLTMLLSNASVQEELKLDDSQKEKAREFAEQAREKMTAAREELQNLSQDERMKKFRELSAESNAAARKFAGEALKPEQVKRLEQIELQVGGANAFAEESLQKKLGLNDEQKSAVASIIEASNQESREIFSNFQNDREGSMEKLRELRKSTLEKVQGKLTPEQKTKYTELLGSPFEIKFEGGPGR
jgi:Spy/CpxP family protein refolding chaperone